MTEFKSEVEDIITFMEKLIKDFPDEDLRTIEKCIGDIEFEYL